MQIAAAFTQFCSTLLKPYRTYDKHSHAVSHNLTLFNFSGTLRSARSVKLTLCLFGFPLKSVPIWAKNNNPTQRVSCAPLKMLRKAIALIMILFLSASIHTIQLQPSCQRCCSGPAAGCYSCPFQNVVFFYCLTLAYFHFPGWQPNHVFTLGLIQL